ncbi:TolC family protein [Robiginitalea marina]|uniref:TolC family protein n=1 Tax=Robiginitalea marina TaxID=2954105 RepID=A0ABT1B0J8_9FLAO|nr:TolC family protein [Robiginitalea marina]MCO5725397.1 TolC family protein [Robiginitalea marina]
MSRVLLRLMIFLPGPLALLQAQEVPISQQEALTRALEANTGLKIAGADFEQARADYRQTRSVFLPSISASHTGFTTTNPLMAFGSRLNQEVLQASDFDPARLNDPDRTDNFATRLEVYQPVVQVSGLYQRQAARLKMEATALQRERSRDYLALESRKAYMQLQLAYKGVGVLEKALEAATANEKIAADRFREGLLQKADLLAASVRVGEVSNQLQAARSQVENASDYLGFLMNAPQPGTYRPADSLAKVPYEPRLQDAVPENRPDLQAVKLASEAYQKAYQADKMAFLPTLNAFGSYELFDDELFRTGASGYTLGAQLSWDLFKGSQRLARAEKSKAELRKSELEWEQYQARSNMELARAQRNFEDARLNLETSEQALRQSGESLRIRTNRYGEGLEKTADLLFAETQYAQKQLEYYQTLFEYNYALAYLDFLMQDNP